MGFEDSVTIRMGLDRRSFDRSLKGAGGALSTFKGALGAIGASFSLGKMKGFLSGIFQMANDLKRTSQALDVSTDFLQEWRTAVGQAGGDAKNAEQHLERFTQRLAASGKSGSDVEIELRKVADAMAAQPDPVKRAKIAFDAFGKGAAELIPLLKGGSNGLDEFRGRMKLTTADIEALDKAQDNLEQAQRDLTTSGGKVLGGWMGLWHNAGAVIGKATNSSRRGIMGLIEIMDELNDERAETERSERHAKDDRKAAVEAERKVQQQDAIASAYRDAADVQAKADFETLSAAEQLNVMLEYRLKLLQELSRDNTPSISNAKKLGALPGLTTDINELQNKVGPAAAPAGSPAAQTDRDRSIAANPRLGEMLAEQQRLAGMSARDRSIEATRGMQGMLGDANAPAGKQGVEDAIRNTSAKLDELLKLAQTQGILIRPTNGE